MANEFAGAEARFLAGETTRTFASSTAMCVIIEGLSVEEFTSSIAMLSVSADP